MTNLGVKACKFFLKILRDWEICAIDAVGQYGGLAAIWNPQVCSLKSFKTCARILLEVKVQGFDEELKILNIYALYK